MLNEGCTIISRDILSQRVFLISDQGKSVVREQISRGYSQFVKEFINQTVLSIKQYNNYVYMC